MSVKDNCKNKVAFDTWEKTGREDRKLTVMMGALAARHDGTNRQFKPQIYQSRRRDKVEIVMTHIIMTEEIIKIDIDHIVVTEEIRKDRIQVDEVWTKL